MKLSARERTLAMLVGGVVFLLLNLFVFTAFSRKQALLREQRLARENERAAMEQLLAEREQWEQRDSWLSEKQPKMTNENAAGVQLLDQIRDLARPHEVTLENLAISTPARTQWYHAVSVTLETRSSWQGLIKFLQTTQTPEQFVVFESANIQIDANDPSQMRGRFKIARWYTP